jgi:dienelactone hydrolase
VLLAGARAGLPIWTIGSFHGGLTTKSPAAAGAVKARIFVANGAADKMSPPADVAAFEAEMTAAKVEHEVVSYANALHAFTNPAATELGKKFKMPIAYDKAADEKSWADFLAFVEKGKG